MKNFNSVSYLNMIQDRIYTPVNVFAGASGKYSKSSLSKGKSGHKKT